MRRKPDSQRRRDAGSGTQVRQLLVLKDDPKVRKWIFPQSFQEEHSGHLDFIQPSETVFGLPISRTVR